MALDPEFKAKWIAALRSGEYRQGKHYLREGSRFCCLGVACNLIDPGAWEYDEWREEDTQIPSAVAASIGLGTERFYLADLNDAGSSFSQIADYIERSL